MDDFDNAIERIMFVYEGKRLVGFPIAFVALLDQVFQFTTVGG